MSKNSEEKEPEVHSIEEMPLNNGKKSLGASDWQKAFAFLLALGAILYDVSPIDLSPDAVPVVGWLDDVGVTLVAGLNLLEKIQSNQNGLFAKMLRMSKWLLIILLVIAGLIVVGLLVGIFALIKSMMG